MSMVCKKSDGYGIVIQVYSKDHGKIGNSQLPAHAHLFDTNMKKLGKFEITRDIPGKPADIIWYKTDNPPEGCAAKIVKWANDSKFGLNNWIFTIRTWESFH
jgi:hypothetical protein